MMRAPPPDIESKEEAHQMPPASLWAIKNLLATEVSLNDAPSSEELLDNKAQDIMERLHSKKGQTKEPIVGHPSSNNEEEKRGRRRSCKHGIGALLASGNKQPPERERDPSSDGSGSDSSGLGASKRTRSKQSSLRPSPLRSSTRMDPRGRSSSRSKSRSSKSSSRSSCA
jgi:hypothetical protein